MTTIHCLDGNTFLGHINVHILYQILDGVDNLAELRTLLETGYKHLWRFGSEVRAKLF